MSVITSVGQQTKMMFFKHQGLQKNDLILAFILQTIKKEFKILVQSFDFIFPGQCAGVDHDQLVAFAHVVTAKTNLNCPFTTVYMFLEAQRESDLPQLRWSVRRGLFRTPGNRSRGPGSRVTDAGTKVTMERCLPLRTSSAAPPAGVQRITMT